MDRVAVFIQSCAADRANGRQFAGLDTWGAEWGLLVERRIILGQGNTSPIGSEIILDAPDGYGFLPWKVKAACCYALEEGYDFVFYSDTDTYVHVPRLLKVEYSRNPYIGFRCTNETYASGGAGFWLGREALACLAAADGGTGYSDMWVGHTLGKENITLLHDDRYHPVEPSPIPGDFISAHLGRSTNGFQPEWMHAFHKKVMAAEKKKKC